MTSPQNLLLACVFAGALVLAACSHDTPRPDAPTPRIISQTPALTGLLLDLGLGEHLVGVSNYCDLPETGPQADVPRVCDALGIRAERLLATAPDVILTQTDPNSPMFQTVHQLAPDVKLVHIPLETLADLYAATDTLATETGKPALRDIGQSLRKKLDAYAMPASKTPLRVLFAQDFQTPLVAAGDTFIDDLIRHAGGTNAGNDVPGSRRWRSAKVEAILHAAPDVLILKTLPEKADALRNFWLAQDFPAARNRQVYTVTDNRWLRLGLHVDRLAKKMHEILQAAGETR